MFYFHSIAFNYYKFFRHWDVRRQDSQPSSWLILINAMPEGSNILIVCDLEKHKFLTLHMLPKLRQIMQFERQALAHFSPVRLPELKRDVWPWLLYPVSKKEAFFFKARAKRLNRLHMQIQVCDKNQRYFSVYPTSPNLFVATVRLI